MELCSLHPFDEAAVREFVELASSDAAKPTSVSAARAAVVADARRALDSIRRGEDRGRHELTLALARDLAKFHPSFVLPGHCLTTWEARIDRGIGMLMRPPARLFIDAGLDPALARTLPIRLDQSRGMMGGAYIPARLVGDLDRLLDSRLERTVRRLVDAEMDPVATLGLMMEAVTYARANGLAIFEALDVVTPDGGVPGVPGARIVTADRRRLDKALLTRIETAAKPPKKPGFWSRLTGRANQQRNEQINGEGGMQ
jgi:hypothetical protein